MTIKSIYSTYTSRIKKKKNKGEFNNKGNIKHLNENRCLAEKKVRKGQGRTKRKKNKANYEDDAWEEETQDESIILVSG